MKVQNRFLARAVYVSAVVGFFCASRLTVLADDKTVPVGTQKQLFVDDYVVAAKENVTLEAGQAKKYGVVMKPSLPTDFQSGKVHDGPDGGMASPRIGYEFPSHFCWFWSPYWNKDKKIFQMWYLGSNRDGSGLAYAESNDGIHWTKPMVSEDGKSNLVLVMGSGEGLNGICVTLDPSVPYGAPDKFKCAYYPMRGPCQTRLGYSADGISWKFYNNGQPVTGRAADTNNQIMWNPLTKRYLLQCRQDFAGGGGLGENRGVRIMEHSGGNYSGEDYDLSGYAAAGDVRLVRFIINSSHHDEPLQPYVGFSEIEFHGKGEADPPPAPPGDIITGVTIEDFSSQHGNRSASNTINKSGLTDGMHDTDWATAWMTDGPTDALPNHITYDLGGNYNLTGFHLWNYNESGGAYGAKDVEIHVASSVGGSFTKLDDFVFTQASGANDLLNHPTAWRTLTKFRLNDPDKTLIPGTKTPVYQLHTFPMWYYEGVWFGLTDVLAATNKHLPDSELDFHTPHKRGVWEFYMAPSRDAVNYDFTAATYSRKALIPRGPAGSFDKDGVRPPSNIITHKDEHWIYYLAVNERWGAHKWDARLALAKLRLDGFFFLEAKEKPGTVVTKPFKLEGDKLQVNVDAVAGYVKVELLDAAGKPIPGFSGDAAQTYRGYDNLRLEPRWKGQPDLSALEGKEVRLRFHLTNAKLYAFQLR